MKTIINALKEIIKKDASTQTEPVVITQIQEEEDMTEGLNIKRKGVSLDNDEIHKKLKITEDVSKTISGKEHAAHQQEEIEEEELKSDASFYDKCKAYLDSFDSKGENYYSIKGGTKHEVITKLLPLEASIDSIFATNINEQYTQEMKEENLKALVAGMYMAYTDLKADLETARNTKDEDYHQLLSDVMRDRFGKEISGEVMYFLEYYGE